MNKIALVVTDIKKNSAAQSASVFADALSQLAEVRVCETLSEVLPGFSAAHDDELFSWADTVAVLGGDGSLLNTVRRAAPYGKVVAGINIGHLGFLTAWGGDDLAFAAKELSCGNFNVEERSMLCAKVGGAALFALNDAVLSRGGFSRPLTVSVESTSAGAMSYRADGLIVSTPTGSTAYSLSAGGPIVSPTMHLFVVTPICAHALASRSIILPDDEPLFVSLEKSAPESVLTLDGQTSVGLSGGDNIEITKAPFPALVARPKNREFLALVRQKLGNERTEDR